MLKFYDFLAISWLNILIRHGNTYISTYSTCSIANDDFLKQELWIARLLMGSAIILVLIAGFTI